MIVQHDPGRPNDAVSIDPDNPSVLRVAALPLPGGGRSEPASFDLTHFQGQPWRLYIEQDGTYSTEPGDHWWLLAEAVLPERSFAQVDTGRVDDNGQPIFEMVEQPLDLNDVPITVFPQPEVA